MDRLGRAKGESQPFRTRGDTSFHVEHNVPSIIAASPAKAATSARTGLASRTYRS
jgi:hypothetical protein